MNKLVSGCLGLASLALVGCVSSGAPGVAPDPWGLERQREWNQLNQLKSDLSWHHSVPVKFDFDDVGQVTVRSWFLEGGPGWEYVRARFTYENTTANQMERVDIELHVLDDEGRIVTSSRVGLTHPWGRPLAPGTCFSDEIKVPTAGAHLNREGWHWRVECRGRVEPARGSVGRVENQRVAVLR